MFEIEFVIDGIKKQAQEFVTLKDEQERYRLELKEIVS